MRKNIVTKAFFPAGPLDRYCLLCARCPEKLRPDHPLVVNIAERYCLVLTAALGR